MTFCDRLLLAECKWTSDPVGRGLVKDLRTKADSVRWGPTDRSERFALFSKSRITDNLTDISTTTGRFSTSTISIRFSQALYRLPRSHQELSSRRSDRVAI